MDYRNDISSSDSNIGETPGSNTLIDRSILEDLLDQLDPEDITEIVDVSFQEIDEKLSELETITAEPAAGELTAIFHKVSGCAAGVGASHLAEISAAFELTNPEMSKLPAVTSDMQRVFQQSFLALNEMIKS